VVTELEPQVNWCKNGTFRNVTIFYQNGDAL
jgi:hypothetical protein